MLIIVYKSDIAAAKLHSGKCPCSTRDTAGPLGPRICSLLPHGHVRNTKTLDVRRTFSPQRRMFCWLAPSDPVPTRKTTQLKLAPRGYEGRST